MISSAAPSTAPLLEARDFGCRRSDGKGWLLRGTSLQLSPGERVAIVGPTGSGKTLLLRFLALLDPADAGRILWRGKSVSAAEVPDYRRQVSYLHQRPALFPGSVEDNLRQPFTLRTHRDRHFNRERILALLADVQRGEDFLSQRERDLSGGERQIVALLRIIQLAPVVLLLDEPTASLDADMAQAVEALAHRWLEAGDGTRTFLWVSHDREQVRRVANRVLTMQDGTLVEGS